VAGLAALGTLAYVANHLWAQAPGAGAAAPAQTRIAVINLLQVIKNYNKAKFYESELEDTLKPYRAKAEKLKSDLVTWQNYLSDPKNRDIPQDQRETGEKSITNIKRQIEDLDKEARKAFGKKREQQIVQLYKEVDDAVKRYAPANGFHLVLAYGEPVNPTDLLSAPNIARKLEGIQMGGACMPMYFPDGMDISGAVVDALNRAYPGSAAAIGNTAGTPGGGGR
jgi:Skp family chaperone for outer membrane proteins